ncbi:hypothetical protein J4430_01420 [Candidatus Woesearchaeota archaeon]|nr:hypothetical protein [Candidatus Woesearchaeota archaeon]
MPPIQKDEIAEILKKYESRLKQQVSIEGVDIPPSDTFSREYEIFREEALSGANTFYEDVCQSAEKIFSVRGKPEEEEALANSIEISHLNITPRGAQSFGVLFALVVILAAIILGVGPAVLAILFGGEATVSAFIDDINLGISIALILAGALIIKPAAKIPHYIANRWRLKASNQMVLCILYVVMYMRHTSNLEHAVKFASQHIGDPLALDLRKVFWDVETSKFSTIKGSLDHYLERWYESNLEFIEAFHLIEESLYAPREEKRLELLDKSIEVMLSGSYTSMLHFAQDLKSPITILYTLGIILPILGLVIFPLIASFLQGAVKWWHLALLYNVGLPLFAFLYGSSLLSRRPTGYASSDVLKTHKKYSQYGKLKVDIGTNSLFIDPKYLAGVIIFFFLVIGSMPLLLFSLDPSLNDIAFAKGTVLELRLLDYKCTQQKCTGPFGTGALILSLFIPLGVALGMGTYYRIKTKELLKIQKKADTLEKEFAGSLFQLGNRIGEGMPVELAVGRVSETLRGTPTGDFFRLTSINIRKLGMSLKEAIFNKERGSVLYFPSGLIESTMRVVIESAQKGPQVVSKALVSISTYLDRIQAVNERLKDLLSDIISSMKSQTSFLTPMIAGIVVAVSSMVVTIVNKLGEQFNQAGVEGISQQELSQLGNIVKLLDIADVIPSFHFQLIVGLFVVEIIIVLSILSSEIESGADKLTEQATIAKGLFFGAALYFAIALIGIIVFNILANGINPTGLV